MEHYNRGTCRAEPRWEWRVPWEQYPELLWAHQHEASDRLGTHGAEPVIQRGEGRGTTSRQEEAPSRKEAPFVIGAQAGTAQDGKSTLRASHGGHQMADCPENSWDAFRAWMPSAPGPSAQRQLQQEGRKAYKARGGSALLNTPYSAPSVQGQPGLGDVTASWALKGQTHLSCLTMPICDSRSRT